MRTELQELTCQEVNAFLDAYLEHAIGDRERSLFDAHLAECEDCRNYLHQYEMTQRLARLAMTHEEAPAVPEALLQAILAAREAPDPPHQPPAPRRRR